MSNIPIFDSLTHPTPNGNWLGEKYDGLNTVETLLTRMQNSNIKWSLAVGMGESIGAYKEATYAQYIRSYSDNLYPIAFVEPLIWKSKSNADIKNYFLYLISIGYVGIKLHPRIGNFSFCDEVVSRLVREAASVDMIVLLCTYCWEDSPQSGRNDPFSLMKMLSTLESAPIVLLHGGGVLLMQYMEIARSFQNVLLDLSFTLLKYQGSSIDLDLKFLFEKFDRRICIGSDGPELSQAMLRERFEDFSTGLSDEKKENIAHKNLMSFLTCR